MGAFCDLSILKGHYKQQTDEQTITGWWHSSSIHSHFPWGLCTYENNICNFIHKSISSPVSRRCDTVPERLICVPPWERETCTAPVRENDALCWRERKGWVEKVLWSTITCMTLADNPAGWGKRGCPDHWGIRGQSRLQSQSRPHIWNISIRPRR